MSADQDAAQRPVVEMPEPGDLIYAPQYSPSVFVARDVTVRGRILVHHTNGQLVEIDPELVQAWYRPYWRRRPQRPQLALDGEILGH